MLNSILHTQPFSALLSLRKHFKNKLTKPSHEGWRDKPDNAKYLSFIEDIDAIIEAKYLYQTETFPNHVISPDN